MKPILLTIIIWAIILSAVAFYLRKPAQNILEVNYNKYPDIAISLFEEEDVPYAKIKRSMKKATDKR